MLRPRNTSGFTIVEVLIVLAIAGLIILIVFLAVPALQRNARNNERKSDAVKISAAVSEYILNNGGNPPGTATSVRAVLMDMANPSTISDIRVSANNNPVSFGASTKDFAYVRIGSSSAGAKCDDDGKNAGGSNPSAKGIALVYYIEIPSDPYYENLCIQVQ